MHDAESVRQCAQPLVQGPEFCTWSHQAGREQQQVHQAIAQTEQPFAFDEVHDLSDAGLSGWLQSAETR